MIKENIPLHPSLTYLIEYVRERAIQLPALWNSEYYHRALIQICIYHLIGILQLWSVNHLFQVSGTARPSLFGRKSHVRCYCWTFPELWYYYGPCWLQIRPKFGCLPGGEPPGHHAKDIYRSLAGKRAL